MSQHKKKEKVSRKKDTSADIFYDKILFMSESVSEQQNYFWGCNALEKQLFVHSYKTAKHVKNVLQARPLKHEDCPNITEEQDCVRAARQIREHCEGELQRENMLRLMYKAFKQPIDSLFLLVTADFFLDTAILVAFQLIINALWTQPEGWNGRLAWLIALMGVCMVLKYLGYARLCPDTCALTLQVRGGLSMIVMEKVLSLSWVMANRESVGKMCNMMVLDFNPLLEDTYAFFYSFSCLLKLTVVQIIICYRLGWIGFAAVIPTVLVLFYQSWISGIYGDVNEEVNEEKDKRISLYSQMLEGIKVIKLYGWESAFQQKVREVREAEISKYVKLSLAESFQRVGQRMSSYFIVLVTLLGIFLFQGEQINSLNVLALLHPITFLANYLWHLGVGFSYYSYLNVVFQRFVNILNIPNYQLEPLEGSDSKLPDVSVEKGEIKFLKFSGYKNKDQSPENIPFLKEISLEFRRGGFYGVVGKVGSGKSALLRAIIGEIPFCKGSIVKNGSVALVEQEPPIFIGTVRENILFGKKMEPSQYQKTVRICCLEEDFKAWKQGDETLVGERGITLSGGQKARISLARALYSDSDFYLLDDPLSAVDSKVAKQLFKGLFETLKNNKTTIFVTHQTHFLEVSDKIIFMDEGGVHLVNKLSEVSLPPTSEQKKQPQQVIEYSANQKSLPQSRNQSARYEYFTFNSINFFLLPASIILFLSFELLITKIFQLYGALDKVKEGAHRSIESSNQFWIFILALHLFAIICDLVSGFITSLWVLKTNEKVHDQMILSITRSPLRLFDEVGTGAFLSRFSNDLGILDSLFSTILIYLLEDIATEVVMLFNLISINLLYIISLILCFSVIIWFFKWSLDGMIKLKELALQEKNQIFSNFMEAIMGLTAIRTLNHASLTTHLFAQTLNKAFKTDNAYYQFEGLFIVFLSQITVIVFFIIFLVLAFFMRGSQAIQFILSMLFILRMLECVQFLFLKIVSNEGFKVNLERVWDIIYLPTEAQLITEYDRQNQLSNDSLMEQPQYASLHFENLSLRYKEDLPLVLKGVSFEIKDGEKVGIVGRTGAGKSSLIQALFRLVEPEVGSVYQIGSSDALKMGLHRLRAAMSIIPQTPFLFKGTIRENIDPLRNKTDTEIWNSLRLAGLQQVIGKFPQKLDTTVDSSLQLFSSGQKQLLCLTRALVQKRKILILDEPTSFVDIETDKAVHKCIQEEFSQATIFTIAHRISTIANYEKIIVMEEGSIVQFGSPEQLLKQKGLFYKMSLHHEKNQIV